MSFLTNGFEALDRLIMSDDDLSPEDQEKRAEVEVEVRASIADEQQEEQEVVAVTDDIEQVNVAAEQLTMTMAHYSLAAASIREHGMARGMMAFINHGGCLNDVLDKCKIDGPRVPSCEALSITGLDASGKVDNDALAIASACESIVEKAWAGIKAFFEKMARFAKEMWAALKQMIFNNDKNLKAAQASLRGLVANIDFGDREAKLFKPEQYNDIKTSIIEGLKFCEECINTAENAITSPQPVNAGIGSGGVGGGAGERLMAAKKVGIDYNAETGKVTDTMTFKPENGKIGSVYDKAKLITVINTCIEINDTLKGMEKSLKNLDKSCNDAGKKVGKTDKTGNDNLAVARKMISTASGMQNLLVRRAQLFINVALRVNSIANAVAAKKQSAQ